MPYQVPTGVSFYGCVVYLRDDDGAPQVTGSPAAGTVYAGHKVHKVRALTITPADPLRLNARGDARTYKTFLEPPAEVPSGELRAQATDIDLVELLTSTLDFGSLYTHMVPIATDKLGQEENAIIFAWRKATDSDPNQATYLQDMWEHYIVLNAACYYQPAGMEVDTLSEHRWQITANASSTDMFGRALATDPHGCTEASFVQLTSPYKYQMDVGEGDNAETQWTLSKGTSVVSDENAPVLVFVDGVYTAPSEVSAAGVVTFSGPPADGSKLVFLYPFS